MPLSAIVGRAEVMDAATPGALGGTYGGNPLACAAALAVLDIFERDRLLERSQRVAEFLSTRLMAMADRYAIVGQARGLGAMQAIELVTDRATKEPAKSATAEILRGCLNDGLIVLKAGLYDNVIRILVPLVAEDSLIEEGLDILERHVAQA